MQQRDPAALGRLGIRRLPVPVPFPEAGGPANVYVIDEVDGGVALFDAGIGTPEGARALQEGFERIGRRVEEVRRIFVSHGHLDHYGWARAAQELSGAPVFAHVRDHDKLTWRDRSPERQEQLFAYLRKLGGAEALCTAAARFSATVTRMARPLEHVEPLAAGECLRFASFEAEVHHLPGHTPGLVCLWAPRERVLFSDDHLLERVSPNPLIDLEGSDRPRHRALVEYLRSAARVRELPVELVLPGHAEPFSGHVSILDLLGSFYVRRQQRILELLADAPRTAMQLALEVFARAKESQHFLTLSEVVGNLEVLEEQGRVRREEHAGVWLFACT